MTLDPHMQTLVDQMTAAGMPPDFAAIGAAAAKQVSAAAGAMMGEGPPVHSMRDLTVDGAGTSLPARLYVPKGELRSLIVYLHGGGWVLGTLDGYDAVLQRFANAAESAILSIDYRLAPDHPFPTPVEDCYAGLAWAAAHKADLGLAEGLPLVLGGDSAGGNLAAVVALAARDRGGPKLALQLLIYPITDADFSTASYERYAKGFMLESGAMHWFWEQYIPQPDQRSHPLASPLQAETLAGLPPAIAIIAGYDPLRDEGEAYAARMQREGVDVTVKTYPGLCHGFFQMAQILPPAGEAADEIAGLLRERLKTR